MIKVRSFNCRNFLNTKINKKILAIKMKQQPKKNHCIDKSTS